MTKESGHKLGLKPLPSYLIDFDYPTSILDYSNADHTTRTHPTQKPVALYEYLIRTYTNPGETVLDFCFGSCTTGVAALLEGRRFVGIELYPLLGQPIHETENPDYFGIASARIEDTARLLRKEFKPLKDSGAGYADLPMFSK